MGPQPLAVIVAAVFALKNAQLPLLLCSFSMLARFAGSVSVASSRR
jgi:hypothetical protein